MGATVPISAGIISYPTVGTIWKNGKPIVSAHEKIEMAAKIEKG